MIEQTLAFFLSFFLSFFFCCPDTAVPFEIQSGMTTLAENKGGQKRLSADNGTVCVVMEEGKVVQGYAFYFFFQF